MQSKHTMIWLRPLPVCMVQTCMTRSIVPKPFFILRITYLGDRPSACMVQPCMQPCAIVPKPKVFLQKTLVFYINHNLGPRGTERASLVEINGLFCALIIVETIFAFVFRALIGSFWAGRCRCRRTLKMLQPFRRRRSRWHIFEIELHTFPLANLCLMHFSLVFTTWSNPRADEES